VRRRIGTGGQKRFRREFLEHVVHGSLGRGLSTDWGHHVVVVVIVVVVVVVVHERVVVQVHEMSKFVGIVGAHALAAE